MGGPADGHVVLVRGYVLDTEPGLWCPSCALPSVVKFTVALDADGRPWQVLTQHTCQDCHRTT